MAAESPDTAVFLPITLSFRPGMETVYFPGTNTDMGGVYRISSEFEKSCTVCYSEE